MKKYKILWIVILLCTLLTACNQNNSSVEENVTNEAEQIVVEAKEVSDEMNEVEGIESVYNLTFEEVLTPAVPFEKMQVFDQNKIEEVLQEEVVDEYTFLIYTKKGELEDGTKYHYLGFITKDKPNLYEVGKVGYGPYIESVSSYFMEETNLFNREYFKVIGFSGITSPLTYYLDISNEEPPSVFMIVSGGGTEEDMDGNGVNELISSISTPVETTVFLQENGQVIKSNLNQNIGSSSIIYQSEENSFSAWFKDKNLVATFRYKNKELHLERVD